MKAKIICIVLIICLVISCTGLYQVIAATQSELENQQSEINSQISDKEDEIDDVKSELSDASKEVEDLINQIDSYEVSISNLNTQISEKETEISNKEQEIADTQKDIDEKQSLLDQRLVSLYMSGQTSYIDLLLSSADLTDFISKYYLISELATYDTDLIQSIKDSKTALETAKTELETTKTELEANRTELETTQASLESAKAEKEEKVDSLSAEEAQLTEELEELNAQEREVSSQIQALKEAYDKQISSGNTGGSSGSSSSSSNLNSDAVSSYGFGWPLSSPQITGFFGSSGKYWSKKHTGVDFRASTGTPVYSIGDGIVVQSDTSWKYGNNVQIYHGDDIYSMYAHNSSIVVSVGQTVSRGQLIAYSGATGNVSAPHLHLEIRTPGPRYRNAVNPLPYLP